MVPLFVTGSGSHSHATDTLGRTWMRSGNASPPPGRSKSASSGKHLWDRSELDCGGVCPGAPAESARLDRRHLPTGVSQESFPSLPLDGDDRASRRPCPCPPADLSCHRTRRPALCFVPELSQSALAAGAYPFGETEQTKLGGAPAHRQDLHRL